MTTTIRLTAIAAGLLSCLLAHGAPCDSRSPDVEFLEPPHTAEQLRESLRPGLEVVVESDSPVAGHFNRLMVVAAASGESVTLQETTLEDAMRQALPDSTVQATWAQLRDHACFPADATERSRVTEPTAFGDLASWRYEYQQGPVRLVITFADALPGLPVSYQRFESDVLVLSSHQARRSDVLLRDDRPPGEPTP